MSHHKVYIIIINYGTPVHTIECLESIYQNTHAQFQVVLVDIQDKNDSVKKIKEWLILHHDDRITCLQTYKNKGFANANNIGIKYALKQQDCDYLWVLNNDTVVEKNSLTELINHQQKIDKPGFVGSKILDYVNRDIIQNVGGTFNTITSFPDWIGMGENDKGQFDNIGMNTDHVLGASMFFHKSLVQRIGLMPEIYFLYFEDTDWCITAQKAGFKNSTCTESIVYHKQGITTEVKYLNNDRHLQNKKYFYLSLLIFYRRHFKKHLQFAYIILLKYMAGKLFHRNFAEAKLILKVIFSK